MGWITQFLNEDLTEEIFSIIVQNYEQIKFARLISLLLL